MPAAWDRQVPPAAPVDGRGSERLKLKPFAGAEKYGIRIKALAVDAREGAVWIASRGAVREVAASGE